ncbi:hypothetical protein J7E50_09805 [Pedobacter sp. ISL-68]|uniref:hypothetical protein n=1 Tax=unclassified Pedobacter TaxID=2628915 RepID=UPI001BE8C3C9|nr:MULTISPECIES: hypothetical protein [unclassified Pedobacter]MBT2561124.1 hypothetical protein [Pedobacter sp. ISL-64]MBT2590513.1 hypothetical protein [Pedobacter sp. ISL-68]
MKHKLIVTLILLVSFNVSNAQSFSTYEEFRILFRANLKAFISLANKKGFKQGNKVMFTNTKANEVLTKKLDELGFLTTSVSKLTTIENSFKKAGFKASNAYNGLGNPFTGAGDLIWSQVYNGYGDSMMWLGKVKPYDGVEQYFIFFYRL